MASGVTVEDIVIHTYEEMKVRKAGCSEQERLKFVILRLSPNQRTITVDESCILRVKDFKPGEDVFKKVMSLLPPNNCCYALYDCFLETKDGFRDCLIFIRWSPEDATLKSKMVYAASTKALTDKLSGLKVIWQMNDIQQTKDCSELIDKLGGKVVKAIEGKKV